MDGRIFHVKQKISSSVHKQWTVCEMASLVDLSSQHFLRLFKQNTGTTPMAYLADLRLESARELIETSFLQIKQIGIRTGLVNQSHFTRGFKKRYGKTPTDYRDDHWEMEQSGPPNGLDE